MKKNSVTILIILIISSVSIAQPGWTWMHGPSANSIGNYGTQGLPSPTNLPSEGYEGCEWTDLNGNFWYYGGTVSVTSSVDSYSALWKFDPISNMWTWINGPNTLTPFAVYGIKGVPSPSNHPGPRGYGACTWIDKQGDLWLFGGADRTSDLWKYNIASNMWTWMNGPSSIITAGVYGTQGISSPNNYPPGRLEGNGSWVDNNGDLWLFGGSNSNVGGYFNDLWKYTISTNEWTWMRGSNLPNSPGSMGVVGISSPSNDPPAGYMHYSKWKDKNGDFWFFGGEVTFSMIGGNALWKYEVTLNQWTCIRQNNAPVIISSQCIFNKNNNPPKRYESRACWTDTCGNFWMYGGFDSIVPPLNDLWCYNPKNDEWAFIRGNTTTSYFGIKGVPNVNNQPPALGGAVPYIHKDGSLWMFGGASTFVYRAMWRYVIDTTCVSCSVVQNPLAGFNATNITGCSSLTVQFNNTSVNSTSWNWNFGDGNTSTLENPSHTYNNPGQYTVTLAASNANGTSTTTSTNYITVFPSPTATVSSDVIITPGSTTQLIAAGGGTYNWFPATGLSCTNCNNPIANPTQTTIYCVEVANTDGCLDTACVKVTVELPCLNNINELTAPNAFSPNQDNVNDEFCLQGWDICSENFEIVIYDRWGEKVFESTNPNFCWDGIYDSKIMEAQVFVYFIEAKFKNASQAIIKKGNVTLIK